MKERYCAHVVNGAECGKPATAVIKLQLSALQQRRILVHRDIQIGRGTGSQWIPVCEVHATEYPDYDGFKIEEGV